MWQMKSIHQTDASFLDDLGSMPALSHFSHCDPYIYSRHIKQDGPSDDSTLASLAWKSCVNVKSPPVSTRQNVPDGIKQDTSGKTWIRDSPEN